MEKLVFAGPPMRNGCFWRFVFLRYHVLFCLFVCFLMFVYQVQFVEDLSRKTLVFEKIGPKNRKTPPVVETIFESTNLHFTWEVIAKSRFLGVSYYVVAYM